jgi:hypothetical protein
MTTNIYFSLNKKLNNIPMVLTEGVPDFTSRKRKIDASQLLKGRSEI